jgi:Raf kinase inhibitor-like YbhB/YbcL family protein
MKVQVKRAAAVAIVGLVVACGTGPAVADPPDAKKASLTVTSSGINRGRIADAYGAKGRTDDGVPTLSLPLSVRGAPAGTKYYAVLMTDPDAKPVGGKVFRHWQAVNLPSGKIAKDASRKLAKKISQGVNDYGTVGYGGPNPPDKTHTYVITVYALKDKIDLDNGFDLSIAKFKAKLKRATLAKKTIRGTYSPAG